VEAWLGHNARLSPHSGRSRLPLDLFQLLSDYDFWRGNAAFYYSYEDAYLDYMLSSGR
jgi:hypothetical protein